VTNKRAHEKMRQDRESFDASILHSLRHERACSECGGQRPIYSCYFWRPGRGEVIDRCKSCLVDRFGEDRIHVRMIHGSGLLTTWNLDTLRRMPHTQSSRHKPTRPDEIGPHGRGGFKWR